MAIKFICSCGKHLRARDEMAARRSRCPRCGAPVGIPSLRPTHRGTVAAPMTPQERRRLRRNSPTAITTDPLAGAIQQAGVSQPPKPAAAPTAADREQAKRLRRMRNLESHWYECLLYPFFVLRLLLALSLALTALSAAIVLLLPKIFANSDKPPREWLSYSPCLLAPLLLLAYTSASLECALTSALAGQGCAFYGPGYRIDMVLKSGLRWLLCWLAGPAILLVVAGLFWLYGGDPLAVDWLILAELIVLGLAYWLLTLVATNESGRLRDANPVRVGQLLLRLKFRAVVPVLLGPALVAVHCSVAVFALAELHKNGFFLVLLLACWLSGLFWGTFLFRLLGVWCYRHPGTALLPTRSEPEA